ITVYLNIQTDPLTDRVWMLGALVAAAENGTVDEARIRSIVEIAKQPPYSPKAERDLLIGWLQATLHAVTSLAAPGLDGTRAAPIHLVLWSERERTRFLEVLRRHTEDARGQTALGLFLDPTAMTETPLVSILKDEVRGTKDLPMLCQTVQSVASYFQFDWGESRRIYRERLFDDRGIDPESAEDDPLWVQVRPRFSSDIPAEYAYSAWGDLASADEQLMRPYRRATMENLWELGDAWLRALRHIAARLRPDPTMEKASFPIPALDELQPPQSSFAHALRDFLYVDRMAEVAAWKADRSFTPEERAVAGVSLLATYHAADQDPEVAELNAARREWQDRRDARYTLARVDNPQVRMSDILPGDEQDPEPLGIGGRTVVLRLAPERAGLSLDEMLGVSGFKEDDRVVIAPRWGETWADPDGEVLRFTVSPTKLLKGTRARVTSIPLAGAGAQPFLTLEMAGFGGSANPPFSFG
ncbi:MAG: hypothetical protein ACR2J8_08245, partial [Thermomicrobiales bacterium]